MSDGAIAFWRRIDRPGHDAARLTRTGEGWSLTGFAAFHENDITGLHYHLELGPDFSTQRASIDGFRGGRPFNHQFRRQDGWYLNDVEIEGLHDLVHLAFGFTPSTNLQQLRHAGLAIGEEAEIPAAWFDIGEQSLARLPQRYRRLAEDRYHYVSPTAGYEAVLELAPSGFVRLYPDLWEMESE